MLLFFKIKLLLTLTLLGLGATALAQTDSAARLRYLSFAVRDIPPSLDEAKAVANGEQSIDQLLNAWLESPNHEAKIRRFFFDLLGTANPKLSAGVRLLKNAQGVYYLNEKGDCSADTAQAVNTWWVEDSETVLVCPSTKSAQIRYENPNVACVLPGDMLDARCGCGPKHITCFPADVEPTLWAGLYSEFTDRGLLMYQEGRSWNDLFAGTEFFGSRSMYYFYLWYGSIYMGGNLPSDEEWTKLLSLPMLSKAEVSYPTQGPIRAPVVTDPNFLVQYNNFRSRVRALSERLLCQDISGALNTDGIATFLNPDLGAADLNHGNKAGCSGCHFAMDNLGSTLLGWAPNAMLTGDSPSQLGHVFGESGEGPNFLMRGFVERGPGFQDCMAKRAFEIMTGANWSSLDPVFQDKLKALATSGPRELLRGLLTAPELATQR